MEKIKQKLFISIMFLVLSVIGIFTGIYLTIDLLIKDGNFPIGIIIIMVSFFVLIAMIVRVINFTSIKRVIYTIENEGLKTTYKISEYLHMSEERVRDISKIIKFMGLIPGFDIYNGRISLSGHEEHCLICPKCGAHLLAMDSIYCEYCGEKIK